MELYKKYISNLLLKFFSIIILTFAFVVILGQFLRLINRYIGKGTNLLDVVYMLTLFLPSLFIYVSPIAIFCTVLFVYHKMINDNELVILEANGLSKHNIAKVSLKFCFIITCIAYLVTAIINPLAKREFQNQKLILRDGYISGLLEEKVFNNLTNKLTIYVNSKDRKNNLYGVVIYDSTKGKDVIISAEKARLVSTLKQMNLILYNGTRQEINKHKQLDILNFTESRVNLLPSQMQQIDREYSPEEWIITDLIFKKSDDPRINDIIHTELHQRLAWPLLNFTLGAIALLAISSSSFSRRWSSRTIIYGAVASAAVIFIHFGIESLSKHRHYLSFLLYCNMMFFSYISIFMLKKFSIENNYFQAIKSRLFKSYKNA